ncbi:MAG: DinB family protein [Phycisphaerales bacterium]|nr:DinB family protein [Phycisphaerales bacterium]
MPGYELLRELFRYNDWGRDRLFAPAAQLSAAELDRPFDVGPGSLRATLSHLYDAEWIWLERWCGRSPGAFEEGTVRRDMRPLWDTYRDLAARRDELLAGVGEAGLLRPVVYQRLDGTRFERPLGVLMLHVCNHGVHHRAQALHMLRCAGGEVPQPGLDYLYWKLEAGHPVVPELPALRTYFEYGQWATEQVLAAAAALPSSALDVRWPIGLGTLRATLLHLRFAEQWWVNNWTLGPEEPYPDLPADTPFAVLIEAMRATWAACGAHLGGLGPEDLLRPVAARVAPEVLKTFPLGVSAIQLCTHGTHHRAQAVNILRRSGAKPPALDGVTWWTATRG